MMHDSSRNETLLPLTRSENQNRGRRSYLESLMHGKPLFSRRYRTLQNLALAFFLCCILAYYHSDDAISVHFRDFGYISRPLWDKAPKRFTRAIRLASESDALWSKSSKDYTDICTAHGLVPLSASAKVPKVYDAMIFSVELDLLEIRMRELYNVVDKFIVVESNVTFSGEPRPYLFPANQKQFAFAKDKIIYAQVGNLHLHGASSLREDPFENERRMRQGVTDVIDKIAKPEVDSIILQSDVDEIPSARAVSLLKHCTGWGNIMHLGMPSYLYSFEFPMQREPIDSMKVNNGEGHGPRQLRAAAKRYIPGLYDGFTHSRLSDAILELAGWHVTFGFRYIEDFIFKMKYVAPQYFQQPLLTIDW